GRFPFEVPGRNLPLVLQELQTGGASAFRRFQPRAIQEKLHSRTNCRRIVVAPDSRICGREQRIATCKIESA
ncbi:MAG: hypothetical protein WA806_14345, partial [Bradyrhizobium sp.]